MVVTIGSYRLEHRQWADKAQLSQHLAARCRKYRLLGEDIDSPQEFFSVTIQPVNSPLSLTGIGIYSMGIGLQPAICLQAETGILLIGFNFQVCGVDLHDNTLVYCHELNSPFYYFLLLPTHGRILVQHEVGVVVLTKEGKDLWKFDGDIITDLRYSDNRVDLQFMDAPPVSLALDSGKRLL